MTSSFQQPGLPGIADNALPVATLVYLETAQGLLNASRGDVMGLIDEGKIRWAFSVGAADATRAEIRIWRPSLMAHDAAMRGLPKITGVDLDLDEVVATVLPALCRRPARMVTILGTELQERWSCSRDLIRDLIAGGELALAAKPGPKESPAITYVSAFEFLKRRAL